jgi:hypothetical protein
LPERAFGGGHRNGIVQIHGAVRRHRVGRRIAPVSTMGFAVLATR